MLAAFTTTSIVNKAECCMMIKEYRCIRNLNLQT